MSGTAAWIIDDDPTFQWPPWHIQFSDTKTKLEELGFNVVYNNNNSWITSHTGNVMGYTSWGTHAEDGNCEWEDSAWVKDSLHFDLANGAVFNTYESFNGNSLTTLNWRYVPNDPTSNCNHTQGLATQFTEIGGTGTMGHAWEPIPWLMHEGIAENNIFFPAYQMGYNLVDAYYQSVPFLAWQNVLVGDPLVRIYDCENTIISTNTTIYDGNYECNVVIPQNVILSVGSGSTVNFKRNAKLLVYGTLELNEGATLNFDSYSKLIVYSSGTLNTNSDTHFNFNDHSQFIMYNDLEITAEDNFVFNSESEFLVAGILTMTSNSTITFDNESLLRVLNTININPGVVMNFNYKSEIRVPGYFHCIGEPLNKVTLNFSNTGVEQFFLDNGKALEIDYTTINNGNIRYIGNELENLSITNTSFNNSHYIAAIRLALQNADLQQVPVIGNCIFNDCSVPAILLSQVHEINIEHNSFNFISATNVNAVNIFNSGTINIFECNFSGGLKGIFCEPSLAEDEIEFDETIITDLNINQCYFASNTGIEIGQAISTSAVNINENEFENCNIGISVYNAFNYSPFITNNIMNGSRDDESPSHFGIVISGGNQAFILNNSITNFLTGISLNIVATPYLKENYISAIDLMVEPQSGIVAISSDGQIRKNTITYHKYGIELGSSSPKIGANIITDNNNNGIYISAGSNPDLSYTYVWEEQYPLSGYNTVRENGLCTQMDYSEIYISESTINLEEGCNTIADDREEQLSCGFFYLMDGEGLDYQIQANQNYWGEFNHSNPEGRFGELLSVNYDDWLLDSCTYGEG